MDLDVNDFYLQLNPTSHAVMTSSGGVMTSMMPNFMPGQQGGVVDEDMAAQIAAQITCDVCSKPAMFVCSACKSVAYCSQQCQVRISHKKQLIY